LQARIEREQQQLAQQQQAEANHKQKGMTDSQEQVAEAWRKAQDEAERKRHQRFSDPRETSASSACHVQQPERDNSQRMSPFAARQLTPAVESRVAPFRNEVASQLEQVQCSLVHNVLTVLHA
jgi:hypothetical protein